jgi:hypothetical protein
VGYHEDAESFLGENVLIKSAFADAEISGHLVHGEFGALPTYQVHSAVKKSVFVKHCGSPSEKLIKLKSFLEFYNCYLSFLPSNVNINLNR